MKEELKPMTNLPDAKVIKRIRRWQIETYTHWTGKKRVAVTNENPFYNDYPILDEDTNLVFWDFMHKPKDIQKAVYKILLDIKNNNQ